MEVSSNYSLVGAWTTVISSRASLSGFELIAFASLKAIDGLKYPIIRRILLIYEPHRDISQSVI